MNTGTGTIALSPDAVARGIKARPLPRRLNGSHDGNGEAPRPAQDNAGRFYAPRPNLSAFTIAEWFEREPDPVRFVVRDAIPRGMVTLLAGNGGAGKTLLAQQLLTGVAARALCFGLEVEPGSAVGVFGEDPAKILHARQLRICREFRISPDDLGDRLKPVSYLGADLVLWRNGQPTDFLRELEDDLARIPSLSLVTLDSASLLFVGNENDRGEVSAFLGALNGMADRLNAAFLLLGHTSKSQTDDASRMASGSTAWVWQARSALQLKATAEGDVTLSHMKANHSKKLDPIALRWTEHGVLALANGDAAGLPDKDTCRRILDAIRQAWASGKPWSTYTQAKKLGTYAAERIARQFEISPAVADRLLHEWLNNDVLSLETIDARNKKSGLKVVGGID